MSSGQETNSWWGAKKTLIKLRCKSLQYYLLNSHYRTLKKSGLFDAVFYLQQDEDMSPLHIDPLIHYVEQGWREGRNPNPLFESHWYRQSYHVPENYDPLLYYLEKGGREGENPGPLFFTSWYAETFSDCLEKGSTPLADYLHKGWLEGRAPNPLFDTDYYWRKHPEVVSSGGNPFVHFVKDGCYRGWNPSPFFDTSFYLEDNPAVAEMGICSLLHYYEFGAEEGCSPNRFFDPEFYQTRYQLEGLSRAELFIHFVNTGTRQNLRPSAFFDPEYYSATYVYSSDDFSHPLLHYQEQGVSLGYYPCRAVADLPQKPLVSILTPVYNSDELLLRRCIHSVLYQVYPHWELWLVDDGSSKAHIRPLLEEYAARDKRIKIYFQTENQGISTATNAAAERADGEFLTFLDHDDELTPDALFHVVDAVNTQDFDVFYSDEDLVDRESRHLERFYKPDFNPELLLCHNYINHLLVIRRSLFEKVGGLSTQCVGAQDYDLLLKVTEHTDKVYHLRRSLYKWRAMETSTSVNHGQKEYADAAGMRALQAAVQRRNIPADIRSGQWKFYYELRRRPEHQPLVTVIGLGREDPSETAAWLQRFFKHTEYQNLEMLLLSPLPVAALKTDNWINELTDRVTVHHMPSDESEAHAVNRVASRARGEHLVFLRQGVLPQEETWVGILLGYSLSEKCGVVSAMITRDEGRDKTPALPDVKDWSCAVFRSFLTRGSCHLNGVACPQNVLAVSFDCCMVRRLLFQEAAGLDVERFPGFLYDIDFCLRLRNKGVEHVVTPFCSVVCQRRGTVDTFTGECDRERAVFQKRWRNILLHNPYYNEQRLLLEHGVSRDDWQHWVAGVEKIKK